MTQYCPPLLLLLTPLLQPLLLLLMLPNEGLVLGVQNRLGSGGVRPHPRRMRREWLIPPSKLHENTDYTHLDFIAKIRSDKDKQEVVEYFITGPGADRPPYNLFVVDHVTGHVRITKMLDREKCSSYKLMGTARYQNGSMAEDDIPLTITVLDENDNAPYFELHSGNISEASKKGTFVMQLEGNDDDEQGSINSQISYSIVSQDPPGPGHMFMVDETSGKLYVKEPTLDRETYDFYRLVIKGIDMGGAPGGLTGTGTVEIKVVDINDNIPTLEQSEYSGSVDENVEDVVVMRIKVLDADQEHTDNWLSVFTIVQGNEDGLFSIETDPETNEGVLKLVKPVDFEEVQNLQLGLVIENVAPFVDDQAVLMDVDVQVGEGSPVAGGGAGVGGSASAGVDLGIDPGVDTGVGIGVDAGMDASVDAGVDVGVDIGINAGLGPGINIEPSVHLSPDSKVKPDAPAKSYPIKIAVNNVPEGPTFKPDTKVIPISEDPDKMPEDPVVAVFAAVDPDTGKPAEDVTYAKAYDPDNWFGIDEETAEIRLNKVPDRESPFLINGTYFAKILAISKDVPAKTVTGTIAIEVTDSNDSCPTLSTARSSMCSNQNTVHVSAMDKDADPNGAPFTFTIVEDQTQGGWDVEVINETTAAFHSRDVLWPGSYAIHLAVVDAGGLSCDVTETFTVEVCECEGSDHCGVLAERLVTTSSSLSTPFLALLLTTLCLLLLVPLLLLFCQCGGPDTIFADQFTDLPFDTKQHLIAYHTEAPGEDQEVPIQSIPIMLGTQRKAETCVAAAAVRTAAVNVFSSAIVTATKQETFNESHEEFVQDVEEVDDIFEFSRQTSHHCSNRDSAIHLTPGAQCSATLYEDFMLPEGFLRHYYSQKAAFVGAARDTLLEYCSEGDRSSPGSVGCCSLLEHDSELHFLSDLDPKFRTLAEICCPPGVCSAEVRSVEAPLVDTHLVEAHSVEARSVEAQSVTTQSVEASDKVTASVGDKRQSRVKSGKLTTAPMGNAVAAGLRHSMITPPLYYTTNPVLPVQYVPNTVQVPGFYVLGGSHSHPGLMVAEASSASTTSPTVLLPLGPILAQNPRGNCMLVKNANTPSGVVTLDQGVSVGNLPHSAVVVNSAATPQGILGLAAQGGKDQACTEVSGQPRIGSLAVLKVSGGSMVGREHASTNQFLKDILTSKCRNSPSAKSATEASTILSNQSAGQIKEFALNSIHANIVDSVGSSGSNEGNAT